jgi:hypothetical protein
VKAAQTLVASMQANGTVSVMPWVAGGIEVNAKPGEHRLALGCRDQIVPRGYERQPHEAVGEERGGVREAQREPRQPSSVAPFVPATCSWPRSRRARLYNLLYRSEPTG